MANWLKNIRLIQGLSAEAAARQAGLDIDFLHRIESGELLPLSALAKLTKAYRVPAHEVVTKVMAMQAQFIAQL